MQPTQRRDAILAWLATAEQPMTGGQLAEHFGVSRQVIVQDMAVLRAAGVDVLATAQGYILHEARQEGVLAAVTCRHTTDDAIREELYLMVDAGACVLDVSVEHPVYGVIRGELMIDSRRKADQFLQQLRASDAAPLAHVTAGVHTHILRVENEAMAEAITQALREKGILVEENEGI